MVINPLLNSCQTTTESWAFDTVQRTSPQNSFNGIVLSVLSHLRERLTEQHHIQELALMLPPGPSQKVFIYKVCHEVIHESSAKSCVLQLLLFKMTITRDHNREVRTKPKKPEIHDLSKIAIF